MIISIMFGFFGFFAGPQSDHVFWSLCVAGNKIQERYTDINCFIIILLKTREHHQKPKEYNLYCWYIKSISKLIMQSIP